MDIKITDAMVEAAEKALNADPIIDRSTREWARMALEAALVKAPVSEAVSTAEPVNVAVKEALTTLSNWCQEQRDKIGAVDGYDYRSGEEFGFRRVEIQIDRILAALSHVQAPVHVAPPSRERALRAALEWYANPEIYKPHPHGLAFDRRDLSDVARRALVDVAPTDEVATIAKVLHEKMCEQDVSGYLDAKIDCTELAKAALTALSHAQAPITSPSRESVVRECIAVIAKAASPVIDELAERFADIPGNADDYAEYMRRVPDAIAAALRALISEGKP